MATNPPKLKTPISANERLQNLKNTFETKHGQSPLFYAYAPGREKFGIAHLAGMSCVVDGTIPPSSGLSSSSALVCCAGLVTMEANQKSLSKVELAEICAKCERYIGTEGGGMDQSISFLAERGTAKLIEFQPLRAT
ncbi:N-acetylgalactosamine kinase [Larimichthys crocea]|uniref:Uncharacterized protein n=1 Tax=Larimichthys crocea TaxID=215358 RepID=A0ACD3QF32_LARCR|nr:N-acetylgalactosamine kinase [Larimichthys crocea]